MNDYCCLDIEFPNVDFSNYYMKSKVEVSSVHHTHLYTEGDEIELRIFFNDQTYFGEKLMHWVGKIDGKKFGSFLKVDVSKNETNKRLQKVDLSNAKLITIHNSTSYYENGKRYIIIKIDTAKFYWNPVKDECYTAEFYLDDKGFRVVELFYSPLFPVFSKNDGKFDIRRMNDSLEFYKLEKSRFRPEFNFVFNDNRNARSTSIIKEPKIQFKYKKGVTEKDAIFYGDIVLMLASFYYHIKIDYVLRRIHLPEHTITIKNVRQKNYYNTNGSLLEFGIFDFNKFLQSSWQEETIKNFTLLSKTISLFNQSHLVDSYSRFLIRYNIIETCDKQQPNNAKFIFVLDKRQRKVRQNEALSKLLETIKPEEHEDFKKRWHNIQTLLQDKPMKNQLVTFLESQNLDPKTFPIKIDKLKELRNSITHGSIDKVNDEQLERANILLYRISGILILNLMGIKDWTLNTQIN